jgi:hypothetical protein
VPLELLEQDLGSALVAVDGQVAFSIAMDPVVGRIVPTQEIVLIEAVR